MAFHSGGALKKVDLTGGPATVICDSPLPYGGAWNRDGVILFGSSAGLMRVNAAGGKLSLVTTVDNGKGERFHFWPSFLPDGYHFLFTISASTVQRQGIYLGSLSSRQMSRILPDDSNAEYSSAGYLIFNRNGNLVAQPFDSTQLRLSGNPFSIADRVAMLTSPVPWVLSPQRAARWRTALEPVCPRPKWNGAIGKAAAWEPSVSPPITATRQFHPTAGSWP